MLMRLVEAENFDPHLGISWSLVLRGKRGLRGEYPSSEQAFKYSQLEKRSFTN